MTGENLREKLELAVAPEPEVEPRRLDRDNPLLWFAGVLAIGAGAGFALGNDLRVSVGLWAALVASFAVGQWCGKEQADAAQG